ncbi:hypothetical protein CDL12_18778 [Handroanthus impetiginosus]|uniref:Uncharacterized protein n=1 Tax=Handroanthus impetiginosus TaxID=429701 RepID=A0A2G9GUG5_9LAMI|nr:hypothetical protein CDL12_18778 [Handroanthus impetiginosus]
MVYTYTPTYYTSLQGSITSICKNILPFSFKKRRIPAIAAADQRLSKQQSDNLKWQQDSFHKMVNLMGLCKEGIVSENEVSAFRTHLLETLIASPVEHEPSEVLKDKLIFLQELLYAKCISEEEYHASKRPLLQRLAVQGAEIDVRDVIVGAHKETSNEEWSVIDLKDDKCFSNKSISLTSKKTSTVKKMKGAAESVLAFVSAEKNVKFKENNVNIAANRSLGTKDQNVGAFFNGDLNGKESDSKSILMEESSPSFSDKAKRKPFRTIFQREQERGSGNENGEQKENARKARVFYGFKKWKKNYFKDETESLSLNEKSDEEDYPGKLVANPLGEGPDTKQIKRKLHPNGAPTDFFVDKVLGENIKKELFRIQAELTAKNPEVHLLDDHIEAISTRLPVDKEDLKKFFPKSWCDQYSDIVLDVVRKEFKKHMRETGKSRGKAVETQHNTFAHENSHPDNGRPSVVNSNER